MLNKNADGNGAPQPKGVRGFMSESCDHNFEPTFQGGDTYQCTKCGKEIDMTEDLPHKERSSDE